MSNVRRVLIFGETGVGKTSMLNVLTGEDHSVSSDALGCTFKTIYYEPVQLGGYSYQFIDTVGLNEGSDGKVKSQESFDNLVNLILRNKAGFNLLIMVIRADRITKAIEYNYKLFVSKLVNEQVPVILVATRCENEASLNAWPTKNSSTIEKTYSMKFQAKVGSVWAIGKNEAFEKLYKPMREESKRNVIEALTEHALDQPRKIAQEGIGNLLRNIYNFFAEIFNWKLYLSDLAQILQRMFGYTDREAKQKEKEIQSLF